MSSCKLFATIMLHIPYSEKLVHPKGWAHAYNLTTPGSAVRHNRLNIVSVSSGDLEVEIFLSDRFKPLQQNCILVLRRVASTVLFSV